MPRPRFSAPRTCCARRGGRRSCAGAVPPVCVLDPDGDIVDHVRHNSAPPGRRIGPATTRRCGSGSGRRPLRHHRPRGRRLVLGAGGRAAVRLGLPTPGQRRLGRPDHRRRAAALLHPDRARAARRGHELSLSSALDLRGRRPGADRARREQRFARVRLTVHVGATWTTDAPFRETAEIHRAAPRRRHPRGRDGSGRALCLRRGAGVR